MEDLATFQVLAQLGYIGNSPLPRKMYFSSILGRTNLFSNLIFTFLASKFIPICLENVPPITRIEKILKCFQQFLYHIRELEIILKSTLTFRCQ